MCCEGYMYTKKSTMKTRIHWECSQRRAFNCKGSLTTDLATQEVISNAAHTHERNYDRVAAAKVKVVMKDHATATRGKPSQILADNAVNVPVSVRAALGKMESVKRTIRNHKRGALPKDPSTMQDLVLEGEWTLHDGEEFLIHDSGTDSNNRILAFATEEGLRLLARSREWFMDGTFATAPKLFKQLYVLRVPLGESAVSCVYAFLPGKSQAVYEELFQAIVDRCENLGFDLDPNTIVCDFELAVIKAAKSIFGDHIGVQGCFFHLTQSTWRKIQELGLSQMYQENRDVKLFCGMIDALAFLPCDKISEGLVFLRDNIPEDPEELEDLLDYFDATYISGLYRRIQIPAVAVGGVEPPVRMRRSPPLFPPETWNVHQTTLEGGHRTNNFCETWNNAFSQMVGHAHPSIWIAIECLRKDAALVSTAILQDSQGQRPQKRVKKATRDLQEKLHNLCQDFVNDQKSVEDLLRGAGHCIRWK